jgi:signal peptidase I
VEEINPVAVEEDSREAPSAPSATHRGFIAEWCVTIILLLFGTTNLLQAFVIPTGSMEDTLLVGDHLLVDKMAYAPADGLSKHLLPYEEVKRGDIIVFRYPVDITQTFVKRCIGVPGDHIHLADKQLVLNGHAVNEPYVYHKSPYIEEYRDNFPNGAGVGVLARGQEMLQNHLQNGDVVVPEGYYFAMGDNRENSLDSRYWGFVPRANIIGKPLIIYWSYDADTSDLTDGGISLSHLLDMVMHFPTKTRWNRSFRLLHGYPLN